MIIASLNNMVIMIIKQLPILITDNMVVLYISNQSLAPY